MTRNDIVIASRSYLKTPWVHQQASPFGMDCAGLLRCVHEKLGLGRIEVEPYQRVPNGDSLLRIVSKHADKINKVDAGIGDAVVFTFGRNPQHLGILTDIGLIHSWKSNGFVVEHSLDDSWRRRISHAFRFRGLTD
jgi:cell wall-associated NlpC family hydrolase